MSTNQTLADKLSQPKPTTVYACGACGHLWRSEKDAKSCLLCAPTRCKAKGCQELLKARSCYSLCPAHREEAERAKLLQLFGKAEKVTWEAYRDRLEPEHNFAPMCDPITDRYLYGIEDADDLALDGNGPRRFAWACTPHRVHLDANRIIEEFEESIPSLEDDIELQVVDAEGLKQYLEAWNERQLKAAWWEEDRSVAVILPAPEREEDDTWEEWDPERVLSDEQPPLEVPRG